MSPRGAKTKHGAEFIEFIQPAAVCENARIATREIPPLTAMMIDDPIIQNDESECRRGTVGARNYHAGHPWGGKSQGPANAALELSLTGKQDPKAALDSAEKPGPDANRSHAGQQPVIFCRRKTGLSPVFERSCL